MLQAALKKGGAERVRPSSRSFTREVWAKPARPALSICLSADVVRAGNYLGFREIFRAVILASDCTGETLHRVTGLIA